MASSFQEQFYFRNRNRSANQSLHRSPIYIQNEEKLTEHRKIILNSNLDGFSKENLIYKIENGKKITKEELKKEIQTKERKIEYRKIINENYNLDDTSKKKLRS